LVVSIVLVMPRAASALDLDMRWLPSASPGVSEYVVHVRDAGMSYGAGTHIAVPALQPDGTMTARVSGLAADAPSFIAVSAVVGADEGPISSELAVNARPCTRDRCTTLTTCEVAPEPDGTACAVGTDPCGGTCRSGTCVPGEGAHLVGARLRARGGVAGLRVRAAGVVTVGGTLDLATVDVALALHDGDGRELVRASVPGRDLVVKPGRATASFRAPRTDPDVVLAIERARLPVRERGRLTTILQTPALSGAWAEGGPAVVLRVGPRCWSGLALECASSPTGVACR
jgi:hypothetical protein